MAMIDVAFLSRREQDPGDRHDEHEDHEGAGHRDLDRVHEPVDTRRRAVAGQRLDCGRRAGRSRDAVCVPAARRFARSSFRLRLKLQRSAVARSAEAGRQAQDERWIPTARSRCCSSPLSSSHRLDGSTTCGCRRARSRPWRCGARSGILRPPWREPRSHSWWPRSASRGRCRSCWHSAITRGRR